MQIKSYSKINLFLLVGKKDNHLHQIKSVILLHKDLYDEIEIKDASVLEIEYFDHEKKIIIQDCNVARMLDFINKKYKVNIHYKISIKKNIPIASGLGGSSSNAAYVAKYILDKNKIDYQKDYFDFTKIGSDIPFFLSGYNSAIVKGVGQKIKEIKLADINYRISIPNIKMNSKDAYELLDHNKHHSLLNNYYLQILFLKIRNYKKLYNAFENVILNEIPELKENFNEKTKTNKKVLLNGSGASLIIIN
ncbi:MAG: hypothetical protein ACRCVI_00760 [Mycoplasmoidaceae bacterium]